MATVSVRYIVDDVDSAIAFQLEVEDLERLAGELREHGVRFRGELVEGVGGRQVLIEDPSGNPVELVEPRVAEVRVDGSA